MFAHKHARDQQDAGGYTIVELLVVITLAGITFIIFAIFFNNYLILYSKYQKDGSNYTELANQSKRVSDVLRGVTDFISVGSNDLSGYAYFSPVDAYTSQVRYYLNPAKTAVMVDVTPMTANPPTGTLITASKKTYTIITNFYQPPGGTLFTYYDASGAVMTLPVSDEHSIQSVQVSLAVPNSQNNNGQSLSIQVSLRNRKTNL